MSIRDCVPSDTRMTKVSFVELQFIILSNAHVHEDIICFPIIMHTFHVFMCVFKRKVILKRALILSSSIMAKFSEPLVTTMCSQAGVLESYYENIGKLGFSSVFRYMTLPLDSTVSQSCHEHELW